MCFQTLQAAVDPRPEPRRTFLGSPGSLAGMENVLFVAAVDAEASHVPEGAPLLITGIGTVPAAIELTNALASAEVLPERVINIGTAGALVDDHSGVFEILSLIHI